MRSHPIDKRASLLSATSRIRPFAGEACLGVHAEAAGQDLSPAGSGSFAWHEAAGDPRAAARADLAAFASAEPEPFGLAATTR